MATVQVPAMVEAMFLGLARGAASRHVVAAAVVAVMRSSVASDGGPGFVDRLQAVGREMLAREAVGAIVGAPFSHAPPARRFLVQTDLGAAEEYSDIVKARNVAVHGGHRGGRRSRRGDREACNGGVSHRCEADIGAGLPLRDGRGLFPQITTTMLALVFALYMLVPSVMEQALMQQISRLRRPCWSLCSCSSC